MKNILLIGAFERDNFGDALMYLITSTVLRSFGFNVVSASIMIAKNPQIGNEQIYSYNYLLYTEFWDAVWVVGGELGGVDLSTALSISCPSLPISEYRILQLSKEEKTSAYIPDIKKYQLNSSTKLILNSVGLSAPEGYGNNLLPSTIKDLCNSCSHVSVRDRSSYDLVDNPSKSICPDIVHALPLVYGLSRECSYYPYIAFQVNSLLCSSFGVENTAIELLKTAKENSYRVKLIPTGLAPCHDSLDQYTRIAEVLNLGGVFTEIHKDRDPLSIAKAFANSSLCITSSLHGRIIASTYNVPRISLKGRKVYNYVTQWDNTYPCDVDLSSLLPAAEIALSDSIKSLDPVGPILSQQAFANLKDIIHNFLEFEE